jgi:ABC-type multidrug transport system ATPase subunit
VSATPAVVARNLAKRFGATQAVDNLTFDVPTGAVVGLIGPNGAGKTTTFSMLAGFLKPTAGAVEVLGLPAGSIEALRSRLGVLPQDAALPPRDRVGEFLTHLARLQGIDAAGARLAAESALTDVSGRDWWDVRCGNLSHGMAKRVAFAQAWLGRPELVLLDEPTAGLDPRMAWEVRQLIRAKKGQATIVISSHNLHELEEVCDAAVIVDRGRRVEAASMAHLTAADEQVTFKLGAGTVAGTAGDGQLALDALRALPSVVGVDFDPRECDLVVRFDGARADAETVIAAVLTWLLAHRVRISGVSKGHGLEKRVMAIT